MKKKTTKTIDLNELKQQPKKAKIHIHKITPGPPSEIPEVIPTKLPVPILVPSVVKNAWWSEWENKRFMLKRAFIWGNFK